MKLSKLLGNQTVCNEIREIAMELGKYTNSSTNWLTDNSGKNACSGGFQKWGIEAHRIQHFACLLLFYTIATW